MTISEKSNAFEFVLVREGKEEDYSAFWQLFENYIIEEIHTENVDDHLLEWYLSEDYRTDFYRRLSSGADPLHVILVYGQKKTNERENISSGRGWLHRHQSKSVIPYLDQCKGMAGSVRGEFLGFCLYEWSENSADACRVICYCMNENSKADNQQPAWEKIEDYLHFHGVYRMILDRKTLVYFWEKNGFTCRTGGYWEKRL